MNQYLKCRYLFKYIHILYDSFQCKYLSWWYSINYANVIVSKSIQSATCLLISVTISNSFVLFKPNGYLAIKTIQVRRPINIYFEPLIFVYLPLGLNWFWFRTRTVDRRRVKIVYIILWYPLSAIRRITLRNGHKLSYTHYLLLSDTRYHSTLNIVWQLCTRIFQLINTFITRFKG